MAIVRWIGRNRQQQCQAEHSDFHDLTTAHWTADLVTVPTEGANPAVQRLTICHGGKASNNVVLSTCITRSSGTNQRRLPTMVLTSFTASHRWRITCLSECLRARQLLITTADGTTPQQSTSLNIVAVGNWRRYDTVIFWPRQRSTNPRNFLVIGSWTNQYNFTILMTERWIIITAKYV